MDTPISSGQIGNGILYLVSGTGSVTYNSVVVSTGSFFRGVASFTTFTISSGTPIVYEQTEIVSSLISVVNSQIGFPDITTINIVSTSILSTLPKSFSDATSINTAAITVILQNQHADVTNIYSANLSLVLKQFSRNSRVKLVSSFEIKPIVNKSLSAFFFGQSNQSGVGDVTVPSVGAFAREYRSATNNFVSVGLLTGDQRGSFVSGYGYGLQNAFLNRYNQQTTKDIDLVKYSLPGSSSTAWVSLSTEAMGYISPNISLFTKDERIVVYYQGESEALSGTVNKNQFIINLQLSINQWRITLGASVKVFFIIPGYISGASSLSTDKVAEAIQEITENIPFCYVAFDVRTIAGQTSDGVHLNQTALNTVGVGIANVIYNVLSKI